MRQVKLIYTPELAAEAKVRGRDLKGTENLPKSKPVLAVGEQLTLDDTGLAEQTDILNA
jgi:hypothetical protein